MNSILKVALIGKVNVGKSTLFNRIIEKPRALISKIPGTTRDRNYAECYWQNQKFILIDSGGVEKSKIKNQKSKIGILEKEIQKQIKKVVDEANLILFVLDVREGITSADREVSEMIRKSGKPIILVVNKADSQKWRQIALSSEYWQLGFDQPYAVSAADGSGIGDLLDEVAKRLQRFPTNYLPAQAGELKRQPETGPPLAEITNKPIKVSIIGRPNVGKSCLLNSIIGEERVIVSAIPHTTREPQDTLIIHPVKKNEVSQNQPILLIDTAGIRRKSKIKRKLEQAGVQKSIKTIKKSDIIILLIDITEKISHQDKALVDLVVESEKGLILVINKIDLISDFNKKFNQFIEYYQWNLPNANWAPIIFVSGLKKQNIDKVLELTLEINQRLNLQIENQELKNFLTETIIRKKFNQKIWQKIELKQPRTKPPQFILKSPTLIVKRKLVHQAQINILKKELRQKYNLWGVPIIISLQSY